MYLNLLNEILVNLFGQKVYQCSLTTLQFLNSSFKIQQEEQLGYFYPLSIESSFMHYSPWLLVVFTIAIFILIYLILHQKHNNQIAEIKSGGMKQKLEYLRMQEIRQSAIIGQVPYNLYLFKRDGNIKTISRYSVIKPFNNDEQKNIKDIMDTKNANAFIEAAESLFNRNNSKDIYFNTIDSSSKTIHWKSKVRNIDNVNFLAIIEEYTKTQNLINQLKKEIDQLQEKSKSKDRFLSILAHDLRGPFNALLGFSNLLMDDYDNQNKEDKKQYIKQIYKSSEQLYHLLTNLLHWTRLQTGKIKYTPFEQDITKSVKDSSAEITQYAQEKDIQIKTDFPHEYIILHDASMIGGAVLNLLSNAVKYSHRNSTIFLKVKIASDHLKIEVTDEGIGMDIKDTDQLFRIDRSFKEKGTENETGTGLGLILCKEFVSQHGGNILVKTKPGEGSTFTIKIPFARKD